MNDRNGLDDDDLAIMQLLGWGGTNVWCAGVGTGGLQTTVVVKMQMVVVVDVVGGAGGLKERRPPGIALVSHGAGLRGCGNECGQQPAGKEQIKASGGGGIAGSQPDSRIR